MFDKKKWEIENYGTIRQKDRERDKSPKRIAYLTAWRKENRESRCQKARERYWANPEKERRAVHLRRIEHPEKQKTIDAKHQSKRRTLGFVPLNSPFPGCEGHHINSQDVIYIPKDLHRSVSHDVRTGRGMARINGLAGLYLTEDWT